MYRCNKVTEKHADKIRKYQLKHLKSFGTYNCENFLSSLGLLARTRMAIVCR